MAGHDIPFVLPARNALKMRGKTHHLAQVLRDPQRRGAVAREFDIGLR